MEILEDDFGAPFSARPLPVLARCLFLVACAAVGSAVAEYLKFLPIAQQRRVETSILVEESLRHFDPTFGLIGFLIGMAMLAGLEWIRRGRGSV